MKKNAVMPTVVLLLICLIVAGVLSAVHHFTPQALVVDPSEIIDQMRADYLEVLPDAAEFELLYRTDGYAAGEKGTAVEAVKTDVGYLITAHSTGQYDSSPIRVLVGIGLDGNVRAVKILKSSETPGMGSRVNSEPFLAQFSGGSAFSLDGKNGEKIDGVTSATKSAKAVVNAVNTAMEEYRALTAG